MTTELEWPVIEYDAEHRWLIATERLSATEYGASAIIARDVGPEWGHRIVRQEAAARAFIESLATDSPATSTED